MHGSASQVEQHRGRALRPGASVDRALVRVDVDAELTAVTGDAERDCVTETSKALPKTRAANRGGRQERRHEGFVADVRVVGFTICPQNNTNRGSAIDRCVTRHVGDDVSQLIRKRAEYLSTVKTVGVGRKLRSSAPTETWPGSR